MRCSRTGGLSPDDSLAGSDRISNLAPGQTARFTSAKPLAGVPDGSYSLVVVADPPGEVVEADETNNRRPIAGTRLLVIRPPSQANLVISQFVADVTYPTYAGTVRNTGTEPTGPFWVEFWLGSEDPHYPTPTVFAGGSIFHPGLQPGRRMEIGRYGRELTDAARNRGRAVICVVDRLDQVAETDETDNYAIRYPEPNPLSLPAS